MLEHYVWSTLPSARKTSSGRLSVPHFDYKAEVDEIIRTQMPSLAAKTTFLFFGYYGTNMAFFPFCKPMKVVSVVFHHLPWPKTSLLTRNPSRLTA